MNLTDKVLKGDILAAARLMRGLEDEIPEAVAELGNIYLHTGHAYIVGITGAPGVGKSTLLSCLIGIFRKKGLTVGVVAVDPTSPFSGGALLGDRIRMQSYGTDEGVFIRSLASRGWKGGLSQATLNTIHVMDAIGKDIIFVEAVGSGQGEVDITQVADTTLMVLIPGMGDDIQIMKAGILEAADIFVVNKAEREGSDSLKTALETMLETTVGPPGGWKPGVVLTEAICDQGTGCLAEEILKHKEFLAAAGELARRRKKRAKLELVWTLESSLRNYLESLDKDYLDQLVTDLAQRKTHPRAAALKLKIIKPISPSPKS